MVIIVNYEEPRVIDNFITHEDCDYFMNLEGEFECAGVGGVGGRIINPSVRKCEMKVSKEPYDINVITKICTKCNEILSGGEFNIEPISVVRYKVNGFYKPHYDNNAVDMERDYTFIIALNDDYEGGETEFPNLEKEYKLKKGQALFFHNIDKDRNKTHYALHAGKRVKSGEKWICNLWVYTTKLTDGGSSS